MAQSTQLEMYKIERQGALDIGTIESNVYQNLLRSGSKSGGTSSILNLQDFIFTSALACWHYHFDDYFVVAHDLSQQTLRQWRFGSMLERVIVPA